MLYKTIAMNLMNEAPHRKQGSSSIEALERYTAILKANHESWMDELSRSRPGRSPEQFASEALEEACLDLREVLSSDFSTPEEAEDSPNLDDAMAYLKAHTPPA